MNNKKVFIEDEIYAEGEETTVHRCGDDLAKIFKKDRRKDILLPDKSLYEELGCICTNRFYLPHSLLFNQEGHFSGTMTKWFKDREKITYAQLEDIQTVISELQWIEEDIHILTENQIRIRDMKLDHILYSSITHLFGIIDFGLFEKSKNKELLLENLKEMNYYLRQGLLWANLDGTENEMLGIDFPEIYDDLDTKEAYLSQILKEENQLYGVSTLQELKHVYQKMKFY
jgi:hypothetical protein